MSEHQTNYFNKRATFIQHQLSGLEAGAYLLEVSQELKQSDDNPSGRDGEIPTRTSTLQRLIAVECPRFKLDMASVYHVHPLPEEKTGGEPGPYDTCLPHITIEGNPALPWLREPTLEPQEKSIDLNTGYDKEVSPWMTILLIQESDLIDANGFSVKTIDDLLSNTLKESTVNQLVNSESEIYDYGIKDIYEFNKLDVKFQKGGMPHDRYSLFSDAEVPVALSLSNKPDDKVNFIDFKKEFFEKIAPPLEDLKLMAHVRQVDTDNQPRNAPEEVTQRFSVLMGNRIPKAGTAAKPERAVALVVSLEHLERALPNAENSIHSDASISHVRVPILYYWTFSSIADETKLFESTLKSLNGADPESGKIDHFAFNLLDQSKNGQVTFSNNLEKALSKGYVPFNHITRGEEAKNDKLQTVSWYRGPLVPYRVPQYKILFQKDEHQTVHSADELIRYDADLDMMDVSYAAAWQLGRLLCLRDKVLSQDLYQWKRHNEQKIIAQLEDKLLNYTFPELEDEEAPEGLGMAEKVNRATAMLLSRVIN